jgi:hypothetical protein
MGDLQHDGLSRLDNVSLHHALVQAQRNVKTVRRKKNHDQARFFMKIADCLEEEIESRWLPLCPKVMILSDGSLGSEAFDFWPLFLGGK